MKMYCLLGVATLALPVYSIEQNESYQRTFQLPPGGERQLVIRNINGSIRATGDTGSDVRVTVREHWEADTAEELKELRDDLRLEMVQEGGIVRITLEGRQRDRHDERRYGRNANFSHDFEVQVPRDLALELRTINGPEVLVTGVRGFWKLDNINGAVLLRDAAGHGELATVNGRVEARFAANPTQASTFRSVNGEIDIGFQPDLSADLRLSTFQGEAFTDFDLTNAASSPADVQREGSSFRYRSGGGRVLRAGSGGVQHDFKTLNGTIKIRKQGR